MLVYPLILFGHIYTLIDFMADIKPYFLLFIFITLTDVLVKLTVADLIATFLETTLKTQKELKLEAQKQGSKWWQIEQIVV